MKKIIYDNERGALIADGKFQKLLAPGKYRVFGNREILSFPVEEGRFVGVGSVPVSRMMADELFRKETVCVTVPVGHAVMHLVDGAFKEFLMKPGTYYFWNVSCQHTFEGFDTSTAFVDDRVPPLPERTSGIATYQVSDKTQAAFYVDKRFVRFLPAGIYRLWETGACYEFVHYPIGKQEFNIVGQELLTADKVSVRINCVCNYEIADLERLNAEVSNFQGQLHTAVQLALREYVGKHRMDELLDNKDELNAFLTEIVRAKGEQLFLTIHELAVKDVILPGEIREIMNTVLIAEKRAQANVISRREEVASTRSLLNTARLMDENETLYKLKQWEYVERICEKVGNINVGGGDLSEQLVDLLGGKKIK